MFGTNSLREFEVLRREVDRLFDGYTSSPVGRVAFLPGRAARSYPLINVRENGDQVVVEALAPGIKTDTLEVTLQGGALTIAGEKPVPASDVSAEAWHRSERSAGRFLRTLKLSVPVDEQKIDAQYRNGILSITLHKSEAARPRRIAVSVA